LAASERTAAGWAFFGTPVQDLRQALASPIHDTGKNSEELAARKRNLWHCIAGLRNLKELRDALLLQEWRDMDLEESLAEIDRFARGQVAHRFEGVLRDVLQYGDSGSRVAAAQMLGEVGTLLPQAGAPNGVLRNLTAILAALVRSPDAAVSAAAARALTQIHPVSEATFAALEELQAGEEMERHRLGAQAQLDLVRAAAQNARRELETNAGAARLNVVQVWRAVLPAACQGLYDSDAEVRRLSIEALQQAATALGNLVRAPHAVAEDEPELRETYRREVEQERADLWPMVCAFQERIPVLTRALSDTNPQVRYLAHRTFEDLSNAWTRLRCRAESNPAVTSTPSAGARPGQARDPGVALARLNPTRTLPAAAPAVLHPPGPSPSGLAAAVPALAAGLRDPSVQARRAAVDALEMLGPEATSAAPALVSALADPDRFVRWAAARTLGKLGPAEADAAVPRLVALLSDEDLDLQLASAEALGHYGPAARSAVPALAGAVGAADVELRLAAIQALEGIGPQAGPAIPALAEALADSQVRVRRAAAELLGRFGPAACATTPALRVAMADLDADVRRAAGDALLIVSPLAIEPTVWTAARPSSPSEAR
jgi:HEAT repeat protein